MRALNILPTTYHHKMTLDLSRPFIVIWLNLAAIPPLFFFGWLFNHLFHLVRSINPMLELWGLVTFFSIGDLIGLILSIILMLILHELIHGLFFWLFTRVRPKFALRSGYAFAAAPEWYLPKIQYILVGLSPLVIISLLCIFMAAILPVSVIPYLILVTTFNAAGSLGYIIVVAWVFLQSKDILIRDQGDKFSIYSSKSI